MRKFASLAALMAFSISTAAPTFATTATGSVNIKWNTSATAALTVNTNYTSAGVFAATPVSELTNKNGGAGTCTAPASETAGTDDFGTIGPDFTNPTDCLFQNAVNLQVATNSVSWSVTEALGANPTGGYLLCALPNGAASWPFTASGAALAATQSSRIATSVSGGTCAAGDSLTTTALTAATGTGAYASGSPANLGEDFELIVPANGATGSQTPVMNITLTAN